jgi:LmbE family N-acetylglucosaminyl deacetylase
MLRLPLLPDRSAPWKILCLGAHSDDIEIGCGGSILELTARHPKLDIHWVVFSADSRRKREAQQSAALFLKGAKRQEVLVKNFRESFFPYVGAEIKEFFQQLGQKLAPDLIFTHCRNDLHQDHRTLCELTWNTFRNHLILEYEIPKYDGDLGSPNCFVPLSKSSQQRKLKYLAEGFPSQHVKPWFTPETFQAILRLRGIECNAPEGLAEAFYCRKLTF